MRKGFKHSPESIQKIIDNNGARGKPAWNSGTRGIMKAWNKGLPAPWAKNNPQTYKKGIPRPDSQGSKSPAWRGGVNPINNSIRKSLETRLWRKFCLERDNFTCQKYGTRGGVLRVHHINNFADFPELRFVVNNGITLSDKAHLEFHKKYGVKNNTREQLNEFLNER